jgi:hypothetical protein
MNKKVISIVILLILSLSVLSVAIHLTSVKAQGTTPIVSVVPDGVPGATTTTLIAGLSVGSTFTVDIRVDDIASVTQGINGLSYSLTYNPTVLQLTARSTKDPSFWGATASDVTSIAINASGTFTESAIIVPSGAPDESTNTAGVATKITFKVLTTGTSNLNLQPSDVGVAYLTYPDSAGNSHDVVASTENAIYNQIAAPTPSPTPVPTPTPTQNPGLTTTTTAITFSPNPTNANSSITFTATVTGSSPTGTITWSTNTFNPSTNQTSLIAGTSSISYTDSKPGNITVTANYSGDSNNNPSSNTTNLTISPVDDFLHTGVVNFKDVVFFADAYITANSGGPVNPECDLNHDGKLNFLDLELFVQAYTAA